MQKSTDTAKSQTPSDQPEKKEKQKTDVKFSGMMPLEEAVSYFEALVAGMKKGTISFRQGEQSLDLNPPTHLSVEVRATRKKDRERISFELDWQPAGESDLTISAG